MLRHRPWENSDLIEIQAQTSVFRRRSSDTRLVCPGSLKSVASSNHGCYGIGERPSPNHKGWRTSGGSHGNDTDSDGASLAGPQPYEGDKREFPRCVAGSLRVRVGTKRRRPPESDGRIPPRLRGGGGQSQPTPTAQVHKTVVL